MKRISIILAALFLSYNLFSQENPLKVETYKLQNGLTVYLNVDHSAPMVSGMVAVKGGSKRDPKDATGIAHYFEHIMFKGTDEIGTIDFETEKIYLDSISMLYDKLGLTKDEDAKLEIQKEKDNIKEIMMYMLENEVLLWLGERDGMDVYQKADKRL